MENQNNTESFHYTYSAKQQEEIKNIRKKYMPEEENKMELLRKLDAGVTSKSTFVSILTGIIGCLILGIGMCCAMVWQGALFIPGIIIGIIGIAVLGAAYPLYIRTLKKERERIAPEVLRLTEELLK